jgi:hypothetical protein
MESSMRRTLSLSLLAALAGVVLVALPAAAQPTPAGPPFVVNQEPVFVTPGPRLVVGDRGESSLLWVGKCPELGLCLRSYDADGTPLGAPVALDVSSQAFESLPAAVVGSDGNLLLAWSAAGAGFDRRIVGRRFQPDGTPVGAEQVIAADSAQVYDRPALAMGEAGELVVVFEKLRFEGTIGEGEEEVPVFTGVEILGRRLSATGAPQGAVFRVDGVGADQVSAPSVALSAGSGRFLVAWESADVISGEEDVLARRFQLAASNSVTPLADEALVHASADGVQRAPVVAAAPGGTFLVAWESTRQQTTGIYYQVYADGVARFPFESRAGTGAAEQSAPAVAAGNDVFALLWRDERAGGSLYGQRLSVEGLPLEAEYRVDVATAGAEPLYPAVGLDSGPGADSGLVAGWTRLNGDFSRDVLGRRYPGTLPPPPPCDEGPATLCLGPGGRFELKTRWATDQGTSGAGMAETITGDTGYFWFFNANNVEAIVKVLNGCPVNGHWWVFAGGLTNVEVALTVRDTTSDETKTYSNDQGDPFQPIQDTGAFVCP